MTEHDNDYLGELEGGDMLERVASRVHDADVIGEVDEVPAHHRKFMRELDAAIDAAQQEKDGDE